MRPALLRPTPLPPSPTPRPSPPVASAASLHRRLPPGYLDTPEEIKEATAAALRKAGLLLTDFNLRKDAFGIGMGEWTFKFSLQNDGIEWYSTQLRVLRTSAPLTRARLHTPRQRPRHHRPPLPPSPPSNAGEIRTATLNTPIFLAFSKEMCEVQGICSRCLLKRCNCTNNNNKQPKATHDNAFQRLLKKQRR